jgi:hypothetical protein
MGHPSKAPDAGGSETRAEGAEAPRWRRGLASLAVLGVAYFAWSESISGRYWRSGYHVGMHLLFLAIHAGVLARLLASRRPGTRARSMAGPLLVILCFVPLWYPTALVFAALQGTTSATVDYATGEAWGGYSYFDEGARLRVDPETRFPLWTRYRCSRSGYSVAFDNAFYQPTLRFLTRSLGPNPRGYRGNLPTRAEALRAFLGEGARTTPGELDAYFPDGVAVTGRPEDRAPFSELDWGDGSGERFSQTHHERPLASARVGSVMLVDAVISDLGQWVTFGELPHEADLALELYVIPSGEHLGTYVYEADEVSR